MDNQGFNGMGKPVPTVRREKAYQWLLKLEISKASAYDLVKIVSDRLERDKPFEAQEEAMKVLDLTGYYRLMAVLLTD